MSRREETSKIRILRKKWRYTQEELARELNTRLLTTYGKSAVSKWESDSVKPPIEVLEELENLFGQREGYLLEAYGYLGEAVMTATRRKRSRASEFQVGILKMPLVRVIGGDGQTRYNYPGGIRTVFHNTRLVLPQDIHDHYHELLRARREESPGTVFEQRNMIRLDDYEIGLSDPDDRPYPLILHVSLTDYYDMMVTNRSLDTKVKGGRMSLRDVYAGDPLDFATSELSNPLAVNLALVTNKDMKIYVALRGKKVATNPGGYGPAVSGTANPAFDIDFQRNYNPFLTAQRESYEEITSPYRPALSEITFFGLARTLRYYFPFLFGEIRLSMTESDIASFTPQDNWDTRRLVSIPFTVEGVIDYIKQIYRYMKENDDDSPGTTVFSLYQSLIYQYPDQREKINDMLTSP